MHALLINVSFNSQFMACLIEVFYVFFQRGFEIQVDEIFMEYAKCDIGVYEGGNVLSQYGFMYFFFIYISWRPPSYRQRRQQTFLPAITLKKTSGWHCGDPIIANLFTFFFGERSKNNIYAMIWRDTIRNYIAVFYSLWKMWSIFAWKFCVLREEKGCALERRHPLCRFHDCQRTVDCIPASWRH